MGQEHAIAGQLNRIAADHDIEQQPPIAETIERRGLSRGKGRQRLRLPCFLIGSRISLLPAFGAFTGGYAVEQDADCRIFVTGDHEVWPVR